MKAQYKKKKSRVKMECVPTAFPTNFPSPAKTNKGLLIFIALKLKKKRKKNRLTQKFLSQVKKKNSLSPVLK